MTEKRYFSVAEANQLIPRIREIVEQLRDSRKRLLTHRPTAEAVAQKASGNGGGSDSSGYFFEYSQRYRRSLAHLETLGVVVKDIERGLIDFPHWREGREVYLCWEYGEARIDYWHEIDSGYSGRQPL
jgi:hypothetical protein